MGVHGLKHLIQWHHKSCLSSRSLHGCRLLIDGNNLAYLLYTRAPGICSPLGGDYDKFATHVAYFFAKLQQCDIEATVLMDGGQPRDNVKLHTCTTRLQVTLNTCMDLKPSQGGYIRVFPLHARSVFLSVLKRLGVLVIQCDFEADQDLAYLAKRYNAKVLSNDSDFFLYNVDYVLLDSLKYHKVKKRVDRQGVQRWSIPCKMFLKETFLGQCRLQPQHLGLIAALCGNDCVPASYLKEFHEYINSGRRRKVGYTKRQNLIQLVMAFLTKQGKGGTADAIIDKVVQRVRGDLRPRLRSLLLLSVSSYRPSSSNVEEDVLAGWRIRKKLRGEDVGNEQSAEKLQEKGERSSGLRSLDPQLKSKEKKQNISLSNQLKSDRTGNEEEAHTCSEIQSKLKDSATTKSEQDDNDGCECSDLWLGLIDLPGDDVLLKNRSVSDDGIQDDPEEDVVGMEMNSGDESDDDGGDDTRVRLVGDTEEEEEEEEEGVELESDEDNDGICDNDVRHSINDDSIDASEDVIVTTDAKEVKSSTPNEGQENDGTQRVDAVPDAPPVRNWETMSKKQRKKETERLKHQERMNRKLNKKAEVMEIEKISRKEKPSNTLDITGMDANQILKALEMKEKGLLVQDTDKDASETESYPLLSDMTLSALDVYPPAIYGDGTGCSHGCSNLVTSTGYRLPAWLMYGYRHCCVTREVSDIVTNNFCISPPQVEDVDGETSYRATERLLKLIVVLARGGGTDQTGDDDGGGGDVVTASYIATPAAADISDCTDTSNVSRRESDDRKGKRKLRGQRKKKDGNKRASKVHDVSLSEDDVREDSMARSSSSNKNKKQRKRKNEETLRWFIRDRDDLLVEEIVLREIFEEFSVVPSLKSIKPLSRDERKSVFLQAVFGEGVNACELLDLPEEFQLVMINICYWYKNSFSPVNEKHVLSVLLSLIIFYVVCGKINRPREFCHGVACVHCILKQSEDYRATRDTKKLVDTLPCNKGVFHSKKYKKMSPKNKKLNSKRISPNDMIEVTDDEEWELPAKGSSISQNTMAASGEEVLTKRFDCAEELIYLSSTLTEEECYNVDDRMTGFHNSYSIDNSNFDVQFVHSMSEYQASVHYLNLLNGLMMMPFPPVYMERIWSGTFCFNTYKTLCQFSDRLDLLVALLLGPQSCLLKIFVHLFSFLKRFLGLRLDISVSTGLDQDSVIERFLQQPASTMKAKKVIKKKEFVLKKTKEKVEMEVDEHCAILCLSATNAL